MGQCEVDSAHQIFKLWYNHNLCEVPWPMLRTKNYNVLLLATGKKSSDPESPAYTRTLFNFTLSLNKRKAEQTLARHEAAKRRRLNRAAVANNQEVEDDEGSSRWSVGVQCNMSSQSSIAVQTDMTMADLAALEDECQQRVNEVQVLQGKGSQRAYPIRENLSTDKKLRTFYTGLTCMKVLLAVFNLVSSALPMTNGRSKLTHFECFTLTLMKLRLNLSNYDLAFRFSVSESTVGRVFSKWI